MTTITKSASDEKFSLETGPAHAAIRCFRLATLAVAAALLGACGGGGGSSGGVMPSSFTVGGSVSGLSGTGLVLQINGGGNLDVAAGATSFAFPTALASGTAYSVSVLTQPSNPVETCTLSGASGTVGSSDVTSVAVTCKAGVVQIGGTISGLTGSGLVLQDNGADNLNVAAKATSFAFSTAVAIGGTFDVKVLTQPSNPAQVCTVTGGSGTVTNANVTSVSISCTTTTGGGTSYQVGGSVSGLAGSGLVLADNGGDHLSVASNATSFVFSTALASGSAYAVTVVTQPSNPTQSCSVSRGSGTVGAANVTTVAVACVTSTFTIGGSISGLTSAGLVLQDTAGEHLSIAANARSFLFHTAVASGSAYAVSVLTQPSNPAQTCTVANGSGTVGGGNVTTVAVTCAAPTYTVGGTVSGLTSGGLILQNEAGDNLTVAAKATTFTFATALHTAAPYAVTVLSQPATPAEVCTVANGSGTVASANITSVSVSCVPVGQFVFVTNEIDGASANGDVSAYAINPTTGALTAAAGSPFALGPTDQYPTAIAVDQNGHAYVSNKHSSNLTVLNIGAGGVLTVNSDQVTANTSGTAIAFNAANEYLYVGGYDNADPTATLGFLAGYVVTPSPFALTPTQNGPYQAENAPIAVAIDPTGGFVFASDNSHDWLIVYTTGAGGVLTQVTNSPFSSNQGTPYGVAVWPLGTAAGGYVYTANSPGTITGWAYDSTGNNLTQVPLSPIATGGTQPEGIAIDPAGKYLFVTNYLDGNLTSFSIDAPSGTLTQIGSPVATGNLNGVANPGPIAVQVDPSSQYVYVVNYLDTSVSLFTLNAGALTLKGTYAAGTDAAALAIY